MLKLDHFTGVMGIPSGSGRERERRSGKRQIRAKKKRNDEKSRNPPFVCALRDPALPEA